MPKIYFIYPPVIADVASRWYKPNTPFGPFKLILTPLDLRRAMTSSISCGVLYELLIPTIFNFLFGMSISIRSSSSTKAIVPPSAASGEICPIAGPLVAPENLS